MARFLIYGSGLIGCTIGGWLQSGGSDVEYIARNSRRLSLKNHGIRLSSMHGTKANIPSDSIRSTESISKAAPFDMVLLCVKSTDTARAAADLGANIPSRTPIISLQNGLDNVSTLRAALPNNTIVTGMVGFNVVEPTEGNFAIATEGDVYVDDIPEVDPFSDGLSNGPITLIRHANMRAVQWGKLMLNLNNGLNALSGLPLVQQTSDPDWRRLLALCMDEALKVANSMGEQVAKVGKIDPRFAPKLLRLPNWLYLRIAGKMLRIDPDARSSMADDLARGRTSEIDHLNGKLCALGRENNIPTPTNDLVTEKVKELFEARNGIHQQASELLNQLN